MTTKAQRREVAPAIGSVRSFCHNLKNRSLSPQQVLELYKYKYPTKYIKHKDVMAKYPALVFNQIRSVMHEKYDIKKARWNKLVVTS